MLGIVSGVITALLLALFIGGWLWAWSSRRTTTFEAAARLPLQDDMQEGDAETRCAGAAGKTGSRP